MSDDKKTSTRSQRNHKKKTKMATWKKVCLIITTIIVLLAIIGVIAFNVIFGKMNKVKLDSNNLSINSDLDQYTNIKNIALFGVDATEGGVGRSDSIMIVSINNKNETIKVSSIIRDSYVTIPGRSGKDKINHAYAFGGPELAIKTLNENFNLNITSFATVNFSSLPKLIDSVGGITLNITSEELKYINTYVDGVNKANNTNSPRISKTGEQLLDGTQALAYSRIRYTTGGDFERSHRHRIVLTGLFDKFKNLSVGDYPKIVNELLPLVDTSMGATDIISLALEVNGFKNKNLIQNRFPMDEDGSGQTIGGIYYFVFDEETTNKKMHDFIFEN